MSSAELKFAAILIRVMTCRRKQIQERKRERVGGGRKGDRMDGDVKTEGEGRKRGGRNEGREKEGGRKVKQ